MGISRQQIKKGVILSVSVSITALILVMFLSQSKITIESFFQLDLNYFVLAGMLTLIFWLFRALKLQVLIRAMNGKIKLKNIFGIYLASAFVSHVTPSSFGGLPFQVYFLHKEGLPLGKATALSVLDSMLTIIFFMVTTPFLLFVWGEQLRLGSRFQSLFYLATILLTIFILVSLVLIFNAGRAKVFLNWLASRRWVKSLFKEETLERFINFIEREIDFFNEGIRILSGSWKDMFLAIVYTVLYWVFYLSLAPVLLAGLGVKITLPPVIIAQLVFNFIQPVIPTPGGSGGAELGFAYLFKFLVPGYLLAVFVAIWRFFTFYLSLIIGGIYFVKIVQGSDFVERV
jgi:hypothetical protein